MADFNVNYITGKQGQQGTVLAGVTTMSSTGSMRIPSGPTEQRGGRGRALVGGNYPVANVLQRIEIATTGNAADFGDLKNSNYENGSFASSTRGIFMGGGGDNDAIDYVTISSGGGASEFSETGMIQPCYPWPTGFNNSTRGGVMGGAGPAGRVNVIQYVTIATTGKSSDFGDLMLNSRRGAASSSPTRAVHYTGRDDSPGTGRTKLIQYITTATKGDALEFGELSDDRDSFTGCSGSSTRGIIGGGVTPAANVNTIEYVTIATLSNSVNFGDLTDSRRAGGGASSQTRALFCGGYTPGVNIIDYVTITTEGDAKDFGDMSVVTYLAAACSDVNGGLGD